ncbi:hypothetical protein AC579_1797 [Pseudocercospora musae]|uniref:Uncharacterized protein n=1 Tax=Pseudocercospora musae TaxID=113226 RepID=A0A139I112_9PEZI|nr:hypothetical protein AC579_1797 [Pseudocercospora musae]
MNQFSIDIRHWPQFFDEASLRHVRYLKLTRSSNRRKDSLQKWKRHLVRMQKLELSFDDFTNLGMLGNAGKLNAKRLWPLVKARGIGALGLIEFVSEFYGFGLNGEAINDYDYDYSRKLVERHTKAVRREELEKISNED